MIHRPARPKTRLRTHKLHHEKAIFPYEYPALFSMIIAFAGIWFFSITDKSKSAEKERALFFPQFVRSQTGLGASGAVDH